MWDDSLRVARLRGLIKVTEAMTVAATIADVIEVVRTGARRLVGSDGISVVLRDGEYCQYIEEDAIEPLWKGQRFLAEACISGWAMIHGETAIVPDIRTDERIPYALYRETFVQSLVMAPVIASGDAMGALGAYWSEAHRPSDDAIGIVESLARFVGLAVARIQTIEALGARASLASGQ